MLNLLISFLFCLSSLTALENPSHKGTWDKYYQNTLNATKPYDTVLSAQQYFKSEGTAPGLAVDLGTGTGRDALFLLKKGWHVLAIDAEPLSIEILLNRTDDESIEHLQVSISPFAEMVLPDNIDLINASYSLPFCKLEDFPACWQKIVDHLAIGGRFAGHLFGDRDAWTSNPSLTFHTEEQMLQLFKENFEIEYLQIEDGLGLPATGAEKYWHVYHVVAKKIK